ncbi:MAG: hypothetical protein M3248_04345 [Actinomycetota bacterium]|nr:hypothetical protein [Actinomycetota bacterium]
MFATRQRQEPVNAEANRFLFELEQEFDLMRLRARRTTLEQEETRLAEEQESLRSHLRLPVDTSIRSSVVLAGNGWMRGWWRAVATRVAIWRMQIRRVGLTGEMRRLVLLEEDIEFAQSIRRRRSRG